MHAEKACNIRAFVFGLALFKADQLAQPSITYETFTFNVQRRASHRVDTHTVQLPLLISEPHLGVVQGRTSPSSSAPAVKEEEEVLPFCR